MNEEIHVDIRKLVEFIQEGLIREHGTFVDAEDIHLIMDLELDYLVSIGAATFEEKGS